VRPALIRRPGRQAESPAASPRRIIVAHTRPGRSWIRTVELEEPEQLLELDLPALGSGDHGGLGEPFTGPPPVLVCTNGRRDRCCALLGRPLAAELAADDRHGVWEISHIGGHRFAPTSLVLPHGYAYGRTTAHAVKGVREAALEGRVVTAGSRGRSTWDRPGQAADLAVRERTGEDRADALDVTRTVTQSDGAAWTVTVAHTDGRAWQVDIGRGRAEPPRPESCGASLGCPEVMEVRAVRSVRAAPGRSA
jgi:hypothetical protein